MTDKGLYDNFLVLAKTLILMMIFSVLAKTLILTGFVFLKNGACLKLTVHEWIETPNFIQLNWSDEPNPTIPPDDT